MLQSVLATLLVLACGVYVLRRWWAALRFGRSACAGCGKAGACPGARSRPAPSLDASAASLAADQDSACAQPKRRRVIAIRSV